MQVLLEDVAGETFDLIALPGGMPGAETLRDSELLTKMLKDQAAAKKPYRPAAGSVRVWRGVPLGR